MKKILFVLGIVATLIACNESNKDFTVNGSISGDLENGTKVFLKKVGEQNRPVDIDTTTIEDGKFTFSGPAEKPEIHYIFIDKIRGNIPFVMEKGTIEVSAQKDSLSYAKLEGTVQNDLFAEYIKGSRKISERAMHINEDMRKASMTKDTVTMASLRDEYFELQEEAQNFEAAYVKEHPDALISALIIERMVSDPNAPKENIQKLFDGLTPEIKATKPGKSVEEKLAQGKNTEIGAKAPDFSAPTPSGDQLALKDVLGKVTLIDFWAAWCKPCRAENPNVVKIYNKYHEKGLNIIGVSLDRTADDWKKAIDDDGLEWNHVSNVAYFDDAIAKLYNIQAIPATFLLDENGVIVAKNLRGPALEEKIASMLQ
ncbi:AhpC/TSA family protein [Flavobacteriaceae bacterium F89]|uniref:AhpC/TSA family protein n=1 Tax=Cerina litoralis TaxID=2874477 RepID=A0AAE3JTB4_9FLAO|nr:TlpA disulfide reductase family protein [Cerina litoralis]MCG2461357.1 AhpC/TSA family protein [Cerina litoralis]